MSQNQSLAIFSNATKMLAEANTIQKTKELKDLANTAADWARRKGMGEEAVLYAKSYAMDAERKMGELLIAEAKAGRLATQSKHPGSVPRGHTAPATTASLGITRKERVEATKLAELPEEKYEEVKASGVSARSFLEGMKQKIKTDFRNMAEESNRAVNAAASGWSEEKKAKYAPEMMRQRGELKRLARDICKLPKAETFANPHKGEIEPDALESIDQASKWLSDFNKEYRRISK